MHIFIIIILFLSLLAAFFGKGVYFALESSYSANDKYASKDKSGHRHMLVCKLLVGKYIKGTKSMKTAPPLPDNPQVSENLHFSLNSGNIRTRNDN